MAPNHSGIAAFTKPGRVYLTRQIAAVHRHVKTLVAVPNQKSQHRHDRLIFMVGDFSVYKWSEGTQFRSNIHHY